MMALDIGRVAYTGYCKLIEERSKEPIILPLWETLGQLQQDGWRHAGVAILENQRAEQQYMRTQDE
jgi:hypothetical protein